MTIHLRRHEFNGIANIIPSWEFPRPSRYGVELFMKGCADERFVQHALRLVWTKLRTAGYLEAVKHERENKPYHDRSQYESWLIVRDLCRKRSVIAAVYPSLDVAETKIEELQAQDVYGRQLLARSIKIS